MNIGTFNILISLAILVIFGLIAYRYHQSSIEYYVNEPNNSPETNTKTLNSDNGTTVTPIPTSTYNMQQYYESRPPIGSQVVKTETTHTMPEIIESDIVMGSDKQIRFGTMRGEIGSTNDTFHLKASTDDSNPNLKMVLGDKQNKISNFQILGGACDTQGNCNQDGVPLHIFDSKPNATMKNRSGDVIHQLQSTGNQWSKGHVNAKDVNVRNRIYFSNAGINDNVIDPHASEFNANKWNSIHGTDPFYMEKVNLPGSGNPKALRVTINDDANDEFQIYGNSCRTNCRQSAGDNLFKVDGRGNTTVKGNLRVQGNIINTQLEAIRRASNRRNNTSNNVGNINIGGKITFRKNGNHNSDPYEVEKIHYAPNKSRLRITIKDDAFRYNRSINEGIEVFAGPCRDGRGCNGGMQRIFLLDSLGNLFIKGRIYQHDNSTLNRNP
jgi:hypothetical protein